MSAERRIKGFIWLLILSHCTFNLAFAQDQSFAYEDRGKRDPFLPLVDKNGRYLNILDMALPYASGTLNLSGILWDPQGSSSCLINNEIVKAGESISGFTIENITKDSVTISKGGREFILRLSIEEEEEEK